MKHHLSKRLILKKTLQVAGLTLGSRILGIIRELLTVRYLGVGVAADAFVIAWKIPNSLRRVFADGALSVAFIPTLVRLTKDGKKDIANGLITLGFLVFEGLVLLISLGVMMFPFQVVRFLAPGFNDLQIAEAAPCLVILMPFIFFISSSSLFAGALQSVNHFFIPALAPVLLNVIFIIALAICITKSLPVEYLCYGILLGGLLQFILHLVLFKRLNFGFGVVGRESRAVFKRVFILFCNCLPGLSMIELSLAIDTWFASYLPVGTVTLFSYANRFMGIPMGVFVSAFSSVLLPHFVRVASSTPKRCSFYLLEASKLVFWVTIPISFFMIFFADEIFSTLFLSSSFTIEKVKLAAAILSAFLSGLFFFSLNRILLNIYYAMHNAYVPALVSVVATVANVVLNSLFFERFQAVGLAYATVLATALQSILYIIFLHTRLNCPLPLRRFFIFMVRYVIQCGLVSLLFVTVYYSLADAISRALIDTKAFWLQSWGFWLWVAPLCGITMYLLYITRRLFKLKLYFFD